MKIDIIGWYGKKNVGDESFVAAFEQIFSDHDIRYVTPGEEPLTPYPDLAILGGGAVVSPFYLQMLPPNCPRYAIGIDISYESEIDLLAAHNFNGVFVRNKTDLPTLREKLSCPAYSMPDLSFLLKPGTNDMLGWHGQEAKLLKKKNVAVLVTDYISPALDRPIHQFADRHWSFLVNLSHKLDWLNEEGYNVWLVPCATAGYGDDRRINLNLSAFMTHQNNAIQIMDNLSPVDAITLLSQMDLAVCLRYHAHLFSVIAGTPFVSIEYTRKVDLFLEENELTDAKAAKFYGNFFDASRFRATVGKILESNRGPRLKKLAEAKRKELTEVIALIRQLTVPDKELTEFISSVQPLMTPEHPPESVETASDSNPDELS